MQTMTKPATPQHVKEIFKLLARQLKSRIVQLTGIHKKHPWFPPGVEHRWKSMAESIEYPVKACGLPLKVKQAQSEPTQVQPLATSSIPGKCLVVHKQRDIQTSDIIDQPWLKVKKTVKQN